MSMLHVHRSTEPKLNCTSSQIGEQLMFNRNIITCLYNLIHQYRFHKSLSPEMVNEQLVMIFDINVIEDQFENLSESVLGQCVQQIHVRTDANVLKSVMCKYIYGSRVAADRVKPGTSVPTVGYYNLDIKMKMHDLLQIQSKVMKKLIQQLAGIHDELLKAGDISSVKNTSAAKQNTLANYYEHLDYQNMLKNRSMHAGLCFRLVEEMWDTSPPVYSLPEYIKDYSRQSPESLLSSLLGKASKYTFALNKFKTSRQELEKEASILNEVAQIWRINTDNTLSPKDCEKNIEIVGENLPVSGVVILTDNIRVKLQKHILVRNTKLINNIHVCEVSPEDFNPQKAFITDGKIRMESTNLFVKDERAASSDSKIKKVEFLKMGTELFAVYVLDPAYYQGETSAKNRLKGTAKVDFMMPLSVKLSGQTTDDIFKRNNSNSHLLPLKVYIKDAKGVTRHIGVDAMIPYLTGMLRELNDFGESVNGAAQRLSKMFKLSQITKGRENDVIAEQKLRTFENLKDTFPMHYHLPLRKATAVTNSNIDRFLSEVHQKPLWIMISGLTYESIVTNIIALWNENSYTESLFDPGKLGRHSLSFAVRQDGRSSQTKEQALNVIKHAQLYVKKNNPNLYPWIVNNGERLKLLLVREFEYPEKIESYVEFVLCMLNSERLYKEVFASGKYHLGLGFILNRTEIFETESLLMSRCMGHKLFYSETSTTVNNDSQSPNYNLVTSMQTGHMPSSLAHSCIRYPHCALSEHGTMANEIIDSDYFFDKKKPVPNYDEQVWIPIFSKCEINEAMFEDTFNPYGRSNIAFDNESLDYLNPDSVPDPLSGIDGYNSMCLGMINMNFVFHSKLFVTPAGFSMKRHVVPNRHTNFWFNEFQNNATKYNNRVMMRNLQENISSGGEVTLDYEDLSQIVGGSTCKFCFTHPKMVKAVMSERDNRAMPGRNVYREENDYLIPGSKLMERLDSGVNVNDRYLL